MCGIAGIISVRGQGVTGDRLIKMTDAIAHRGPDGEALWINNAATAGLGHRRLAIIDLSFNAAQPMHYLERYTIVHNGEIYNYIELRKELQNNGYLFTSASDTEVILAAFDCWKEQCLQHFDGMFAFAIWDEKEQTLFAARDRFGEKPFFYCSDGNEFLFASEMKALWAAGVTRKVNEQLLFNFITLGYTSNPIDHQETTFHHIRQLPAASFFNYSIHNPGKIEPKTYWIINKDYTANHYTEENAIGRFTDLFTQSIKNRLRSDVPLGTSLSGGLDSSSIAVMIKKLLPAEAKLQTFSAVFPGAESDESQHIQLLTREKGIDNFTTQPRAAGFINDFEKLCYHQEGYISSASVYAQFKVFELAKELGTKVLLDGQGADEVMAGYHKYYHWYWQELYLHHPRLLRNEIAAARQLGVTDEWSWKNKLLASYPGWAGAFVKNSRQKKQLAMPGIDASFAESFGISYYQLPAPGKLNNILYYNSFENGLQQLLQFADRNSMAHGREVRLPFLQHQLVEYIFSLPPALKIKNGRTKWILRKAMEGLLPAEIAWRKDKIGFEPPQKAWMRNTLVQEYIQEARKKLVNQRILKQSVLDKKIQPHDAYAADNFDWRCMTAAALC